jgi:hypothetical protein
MKGHEALISMRMRGESPSIVFIEDDLCDTNWHAPTTKSGIPLERDQPIISTHGDRLETLDFRFLIGLKVSIGSRVESRAKMLFELAKKAGAKTVAACHIQTGVPINKLTGWVEIYHG